MRRFKLRKWVKVVIAIILIVIIGMAFAHFILNRESDFDKFAKQCDQKEGRVCSYYEVRNYIIYGDGHD